MTQNSVDFKTGSPALISRTETSRTSRSTTGRGEVYRCAGTRGKVRLRPGAGRRADGAREPARVHERAAIGHAGHDERPDRRLYEVAADHRHRQPPRRLVGCPASGPVSTACCSRARPTSRCTPSSRTARSNCGTRPTSGERLPRDARRHRRGSRGLLRQEPEHHGDRSRRRERRQVRLYYERRTTGLGSGRHGLRDGVEEPQGRRRQVHDEDAQTGRSGDLQRGPPAGDAGDSGVGSHRTKRGWTFDVWDERPDEHR